jgi:hypothetical protein
MALPAEARLYETMAQIAARYGQPVETRDGYAPQHKLYTYNYKGYEVLVHFYNGVSAEEVYTKLDGTPIQEAEIQGLLDANACGGQWECQTPLTEQGGPFLEYANGTKLIANYLGDLKQLKVCVRAFNEWYGQAKDAAQKNGVSGF